jgi:predicted transcriptional regulator
VKIETSVASSNGVAQTVSPALVQEVAQKTGTRKQSRSKMEVYGDILRVIGSGADSPTQMMLKANLSWNVMKESTQTLLAHGLIQENFVDERAYYRLTASGYELLKKIMAIKEQMSPSALFEFEKIDQAHNQERLVLFLARRMSP